MSQFQSQTVVTTLRCTLEVGEVEEEAEGLAEDAVAPLVVVPPVVLVCAGVLVVGAVGAELAEVAGNTVVAGGTVVDGVAAGLVFPRVISLGKATTEAARAVP